MGIPAFFAYLIKNHINIVKKLSSNPIKVDNLYLDCNSIIYDAVYKMGVTTMTEDAANKIIATVIHSIKAHRNLCV